MPPVIAQLVKMVGIPVLVRKDLVELAFQLYEFFYKTGPKFLKQIGKELAEFIVFVIEQYPKPT